MKGEFVLNRNFETDVVVIGAGNAAMCAAIAARENGANVIVLEKAPEKEKGGNSAYTHGSIRFAYNGVEDLKQELINIRNKGYSEDNEEKEIGLTCYAVPIRNRLNNVVAAMSISGPTVRMHKNKKDLIDSLMEVSHKISKVLG